MCITKNVNGINMYQQFKNSRILSIKSLSNNTYPKGGIPEENDEKVNKIAQKHE